MRRAHALPPQNGAAKPVKFDPKKAPLETVVEREAVHPKPGALVRLRVSVEAGQQFLRVLGRAPFGTKYYQGFLAAFPLPARSAALAADVDREALRFLDVVSGRVPDGVKLYTELKKNPLPAAPAIDQPADLQAFAAARDAFIRWYDGVVQRAGGNGLTPGPRSGSEYAFSVAAPTTPRIVLTSEYYEGDLDWYDFDVRMGETIGAA